MLLPLQPNAFREAHSNEQAQLSSTRMYQAKKRNSAAQQEHTFVSISDDAIESDRAYLDCRGTETSSAPLRMHGGLPTALPAIPYRPEAFAGP